MKVIHSTPEYELKCFAETMEEFLLHLSPVFAFANLNNPVRKLLLSYCNKPDIDYPNVFE